MERFAGFSPCQRYRYWLARIWDHSLGLACIIGQNPSKADAKVDDPTITRETGFVERLGYGGFIKYNWKHFTISFGLWERGPFSLHGRVVI